jgi:hypothetical protein
MALQQNRTFVRTIVNKVRERETPWAVRLSFHSAELAHRSASSASTDPSALSPTSTAVAPNAMSAKSPAVTGPTPCSSRPPRRPLPPRQCPAAREAAELLELLALYGEDVEVPESERQPQAECTLLRGLKTKGMRFVD